MLFIILSFLTLLNSSCNATVNLEGLKKKAAEYAQDSHVCMAAYSEGNEKDADYADANQIPTLFPFVAHELHHANHVDINNNLLKLRFNESIEHYKKRKKC